MYGYLYITYPTSFVTLLVTWDNKESRGYKKRIKIKKLI